MNSQRDLISLFEGFVEYESIYLKSNPSLGLLQRAENDAVEFWLNNLTLFVNLQLFSNEEIAHESEKEQGIRSFLRQSIKQDIKTMNRLSTKWGPDVFQCWMAG